MGDVQRLFADVAALLPDMRRNAASLDRNAGFPWDDMEALRRCGVLVATLPCRVGGLGLGQELFDLLRLIGSANLAVGRLIEGHVNALWLIWRYGTDAQLARAAGDAALGHLFGIWNTEEPPGVHLQDGALSGKKINCSAAVAATRAVITVGHPDEARMLMVTLAPDMSAGAMPGRLLGMRATQAGWIDFRGYRPDAEDWIGQAGDYMREPEFSAGAWRTLAALTGGIGTLGEMLREQLRARGRDGAPWQAERIAQSLIAEQTAWLWSRECARLVATDASAAAMTGYVNLARRAVEMAGLTMLELVQRSLGLSAFVEGNPAERQMRDLATYLRQPAMDEALAEAAAHFVGHAMPSSL